MTIFGNKKKGIIKKGRKFELFERGEKKTTRCLKEGEDRRGEGAPSAQLQLHPVGQRSKESLSLSSSDEKEERRGKLTRGNTIKNLTNATTKNISCRETRLMAKKLDRSILTGRLTLMQLIELHLNILIIQYRQMQQTELCNS